MLSRRLECNWYGCLDQKNTIQLYNRIVPTTTDNINAGEGLFNLYALSLWLLHRSQSVISTGIILEKMSLMSRARRTFQRR